ncbi:MAG: hypothetical protein KatS3mg102_0665 [Planctomycetota bacterium]|nr:MAG: hypothetical protein KatS3mg102_0665 [Planctomycetota bacterium]
MELLVEHIGGPLRGYVNRLPAPCSAIVGSGSNVQVRIEDPTVEPHHLQITATEDGLVVANLSATHGSFIAGQPIVGPTPVPDGAVIQLGQGVAVRLSREGLPVRGAPPRPPGAGQTLVASPDALRAGAPGGPGPGATAPVGGGGGPWPPAGGPAGGTMILGGPGGAPLPGPVPAAPVPAPHLPAPAGAASGPSPAGPGPMPASAAPAPAQGIGRFALVVALLAAALLGLLVLVLSLIAG